MIKSIKRVLRTYGIELTKFNPNNSNDALLLKCLNHFNIEFVIDVGANIGQYGNSIRQAGYKNHIISFEPISSVYKVLKSNIDSDKRWEAHNFGIGKGNEETIINVSKNLASSSILNVTEASTNAEPLSGFESKEIIQIISLDEFFENKGIKDNIYLKIDVQGYELEVLKGCQKMISQISVIQIEMSFIELYNDGPLFKDILEKMEYFGFEIYSIIPDFRDPVTGRLLQADGIFVNKKLNVF
jgi:FkbM family methyltransferase